MAGHGAGSLVREDDLLTRQGQLYFASSPLCLALIEAIASDAEARDLVFGSVPADPEVNLKLLLATLHEAAITGAAPELTTFFPNLGGTRHPDDPALRAAALRQVSANREALRERFRQRPHVVKTALRRAVMLKALVTDAWQALGRPARYALVDLGCGMGLSLRLHQHRIAITPDAFVLDVGGIFLPVERRGPGMPPFELPSPAKSIGVDLHPLDAGNAADRAAVLSFLLPEDVADFDAMHRMMAMLAAEPPDIRIGSADVLLPLILDEIEPDMPVIIMHAMFLHYLTAAQRASIAKCLRQAGAQRPLAMVSMQIGEPAARLGRVSGSPLTHHAKGRACLDGRWMEWTRPATANGRNRSGGPMISEGLPKRLVRPRGSKHCILGHLLPYEDSFLSVYFS